MMESIINQFPGANIAEQAQVFGAFGAWFAAIATSFAAFCALYIARRGISPKGKATARTRKSKVVEQKRRFSDNPLSVWPSVVHFILTNTNYPALECRALYIGTRIFSNRYKLEIELNEIEKTLQCGESYDNAIPLERFQDKFFIAFYKKIPFPKLLLVFLIEKKTGGFIKVRLPNEIHKTAVDAIKAAR